MVKIRTMKPEDVEGVHEFIKERKGLLFTHNKYIYRIMAECFCNTCFVAENDDKIIGFMSGFMSQIDPSIFFIWQYGVSESHEKTNVPMRLFINMVSAARKMGCKKLRFTIEEGSERAERFFKLLKSLPLIGNNFTIGKFMEGVYEETEREYVEILYEVPLSISLFSKPS